MVKINYVDADGKAIELEVTEEVANLIITSEREEANLERKERYHCSTSLDDALYEGEWFADNRTPDYYFNLKEEEEHVNQFMNLLTETQRRRLQLKMDDPTLSFEAMAKIEGVGVSKIFKSFEQIRKKYRLFAN